MNLAVVEAELGDFAAAFDHVMLAIRNYHDSGNTTLARKAPSAVVAALFDRLGRSEAAAAIAGFASLTPGIALFLPEITTTIAHLRAPSATDLRIACAHGRSDDDRRIVAFAYEQIDHARAALEQLP